MESSPKAQALRFGAASKFYGMVNFLDLACLVEWEPAACRPSRTCSCRGVSGSRPSCESLNVIHAVPGTNPHGSLSYGSAAMAEYCIIDAHFPPRITRICNHSVYSV